MKKLLSLLLVFSMLVPLCTTFPAAAAEPTSMLGAQAACDGHALGSFSGVPACVDANGNLHVCVNNFPDENFLERIWLEDGAKDGYITSEECRAITKINITRAEFWGYNIASVKGIEYFTALEILICDFNAIEELNLYNNTALVKLSAQENQLKKIDVSNCPALRELILQGNIKLPKLDVTGNPDLRILDTFSCILLAELDLHNNTKLYHLVCDNNHLTELDLSNNTALQYLNCAGNYIETLDLQNNTALYYLRCAGNELATLDLSQMNVEWSNIFIGLQGRRLTVPFRNGKWEVDLSKHVSLENLAKIDHVSDGEFDPNTGIVTFDTRPQYFSYFYDVSFPRKRVLMEVRLDNCTGTYIAEVNGTGTVYYPGDLFDISTDPIYIENGWAYRFVGWQGDTDCIHGANAVEATVKMPKRDVILQPEYILVGDLERDGVLDAGDGLLMARMLAGVLPEIPEADINGDGMLTAADMLCLKRYLAGSYIPEK